MSKKLLWMIGLVLLIIGSVFLVHWGSENQENKKLQQQTKNQGKQTEHHTESNYYNPPSNLQDSYWLYRDASFLSVDFTSLEKDNKDTIGWIQIPGISVDYPIVQSDDNLFYLKHNFNKKTSKAGWIFMDYRNSFEISKENIILYGHGRLDGSMFGSLSKLLTEEWFQDKEHHLIKVSALQENRIYQIVSVYTILPELYYLTTFFENKEKWETFLNTIQKRSIYDFKTTLNTKDQILTLSTCQDGNKKRIVVHARLIKKEIR